FYETRALDPMMLSDVERAARLMFLNRTCFNGLWRVNSKGVFNVPFGKYKNPTICDADALREASKALAFADIVVSDFAGITKDLGASKKIDFVYFDPPYAPASATSDFTAYAAGGFGFEEQKRLANELEALRDRGAMAMLSNADTPEMRALYAPFEVHVVNAPRSINADGAKRGSARELLVTTWGEAGRVHEKAAVGAAAASPDA
ncbi:MAG: Dam family site-specific DNA-(adenine-N6)-methyltransferase, partial [Polyangiaceae bacterium]